MSDLPMPFSEDTEALVTAPGWVPADDLAVERSLRYLDHLSREDTEAKQQADVWRAEIDAWESQRRGTISARATAVVVALESYGLARRRETGVKSFSWPSGEITTAKGRDAVTIVDEPALLAWCQAECPAAVKSEVLKSKLPDHEVDGEGRMIVAGEIVPGVHVKVGANYVTATVKLSSQRSLPKAKS